MTMQNESIHQVIKNQIRKWHARGRPGVDAPRTPVVTVSCESGSGGHLIAQGIAHELDLDFFGQELIDKIVDRPELGDMLLESLNEEKMSALEDWVASVIMQRCLWPDDYLQQLFQVVGTIGIYGRAVIMGKGAHFILPANQNFRLRFFAPPDYRVEKLAAEHDLSMEDAKRQLLNINSDREAFARKHFHQDIDAPENYDLLINTGTLTTEEAIEAVCCILRSRSKSRSRSRNEP